MSKKLNIVCFSLLKYLATCCFICIILAVELVNTNENCPNGCKCKGVGFLKDAITAVNCSGLNLTKIPAQKNSDIAILDLSRNNITSLSPFSYTHLRFLKELHLGDNQILTVPPRVLSSFTNLTSLHLEGNLISFLEDYTFYGLIRLRELYLDYNHITHISPTAFAGLLSLRYLRLDHNRLTRVPVIQFQVYSLEGMWLSFNRIESIHDKAFNFSTRLLYLFLKGNKLTKIGDHAFDGMTHVEIIDVSKNRLKTFSPAFYHLLSLKDLLISDNRIEYMPRGVFSPNGSLQDVIMHGNPISTIHHRAFTNLPNLKKIVLSEAADLTVFPDLTGCSGIEFIRIDRASITDLPRDMCVNTPLLQVLDVHSNHISHIPEMLSCTELRILNLGNNDIMSLEGSPFRGLIMLNDLSLNSNDINALPKGAFIGLDRLKYLDLHQNKIAFIDVNAFTSFNNLHHLNLGENAIPYLPTNGLTHIEKLITYNNPELHDFPPPENFPNARILVLSYAYHCCEYMTDDTSSGESIDQPMIEEDVMWLEEHQYDVHLFPNISAKWTQHIGDNKTIGTDISDHIYSGYGHSVPDYLPIADSEYFEDYEDVTSPDIIIKAPPVNCTPRPGPFMPCHDLFGWWSLRCGVWLMFMLALLGNGVVLFVAVFTSRHKMDVTRFLVSNLACADFIMAIYLGILAVVDAYTLGEFKKHAIPWQLSSGCKTAGFLAVLSSEMSVFILAVITLERFYAITHAMQLNKRLTLRHAAYIMLCGWTFSIMLAVLPLFGVSDYRKFAVCLPFEIDDTPSLAYVCFILIFNIISFIIIVACYTHMYCSIRGTQAWNSNDMRIAKRMALLVFTDFACWAPITFFSLSAAFGLKLISLEDAKVFTIFVLPLNSCANPFLYAIFTKQFKRDCVNLCKRIEDSSVSRRLTQFSNRQFSWSWITSRRASASNGFVQSERRVSIGMNSHSNGNNGVHYFDMRVTQRQTLLNQNTRYV